MDYMGYGLMHFLVTGAQGILGEQVVSALRAKGAKVTPTGRRACEGIVCCDLLDVEDVARMVAQVKPDRIIHCAAKVPKTIEEYSEAGCADESLQMLMSVLKGSNCPVVYISSMTVYGVGYNRPVGEDDVTAPATVYGRGKLKGENLLQADGRTSFAVRIPGLFGQVRREGLVFNLVQAAQCRLEHKLPTTPIQWAAMHVEDAAASIAALALLEVEAMPVSFEAVNIAYRENYSISKLISTVAQIYGETIEYSIIQPEFEFDLSRAEHYGVIPSNSLHEALVKFGRQI